MTGTEVATVDEAALAALQAQQEAEIDSDFLQAPILKVGQSMTREVKAGEADAGEFINTLTGEGVGTKVGFIVSYYQRGRFAANRETGRAYTAFETTIPERWSELVGDEFVGTPFTEYPDAEEVYKARANRKEIEWGKGPLVSTTHNFTGHVLISPLEGDEEGQEELQPVRLSLKRTDVPAAKKILTLRKALRNRPFWSRVFDLSTYNKEFTQGDSYLVNVKLGRETTAEEQQAASELAVAVAAGRVGDNTEALGVDKPVEPDAQGGLDV